MQNNNPKGRLVAVRAVMAAAAAVLIMWGILTVYALGHPEDLPPDSHTAVAAGLWKKQAFFAVVGVFAFSLVNMLPYRRLGQASAWIYGAVLGLLAILVADRVVDLGLVPVINSSRRWIRIPAGPYEINLQPSEICKLVYIVALAWYLRYRSNYRSLASLTGPFAFTILPVVMILAEPDMGTAVLMMPILFSMLFVAGARIRHLAAVLLMAVAVSPLIWIMMDDYQKIRVSSVLLQNDWLRQKAQDNTFVGRILVGSRFTDRQWKDNWGYHLTRSKFAVASGGATGHGFLRGPFVKYDFLPERHNDFIFAVISHQWGFVGCTVMLALYAVIIGCGLEIAVGNTDPFGRLIAVGIVSMLAVEVLVNVAMTLGLMPITGLTLPLVSYGGSSLVVSMASIGLLNNVGRYRPFTVARK